MGPPSFSKRQAANLAAVVIASGLLIAKTIFTSEERMKLVALLLSLLLALGCAKESSSSASSPSPSQQSPGQKTGSDEPQDLKVFEGDKPDLNKIQAVSLNQGQAHFDFTYRPKQDAKLALTSVTSYLIGCKDSDIGLGFSLFRIGLDGNVDFSAHEGLGSAPALVNKGLQYLVRVNLTLGADCLGLAYYFGVRESR
jgi:hypothetical protein